MFVLWALRVKSKIKPSEAFKIFLCSVILLILYKTLFKSPTPHAQWDITGHPHSPISYKFLLFILHTFIWSQYI